MRLLCRSWDNPKRYEILGNIVVLSDTSEQAREVYFERLRAMTASERLELGAALWIAGDSLQRAVLRRENPRADEAEIAFRIAVSRYGLELARKAYRKV